MICSAAALQAPAPSDPILVRRVKTAMLWTDVGFLGYWIATAAGFLSVGGGRFMSDWNWSFLGMDLTAIGTGLLSLVLARTGHPAARTLMVISLTLTSAAGLMAVNFWILRGDFDLAWWLPNLWLLLFPVVALVALSRGGHLISSPPGTSPHPSSTSRPTTRD
ncbi:DUF5360 family protein [Cellulosimicrobium cellulans]|uniref:DUF5360 family protein n=1 Tax=Cellulosimicrobium cellulans TaxID=1710 RepID=UPI001C9E9F2A|nr:DUF5360 family protein [Cellulosimicrobium cellulans]